MFAVRMPQETSEELQSSTEPRLRQAKPDGPIEKTPAARIPTFEDLAAVLPNLSRDLR